MRRAQAAQRGFHGTPAVLATAGGESLAECVARESGRRDRLMRSSRPPLEGRLGAEWAVDLATTWFLLGLWPVHRR